MNSMIKIDSVASTMTSREIAELTEKQHSHVCRDIRTMIDQLYGKERKYAEMDKGSPEYNRGERKQYKYLKPSTLERLIDHFSNDPDQDHQEIQGVSEERDERGYVSLYHLDRDHTYTLIAGYRADLRFKIIKRWQELEAQAIKSLSPAEFLLQQAQMLVEIERKSKEHDDRIKRIECKQQAFEDGIRFFTVIGYVGYKGLPSVNLSQAQKIGKIAKQLSVERGMSIDRVRDQRHGLINSYHESILDDAYAALVDEV